MKTTESLVLKIFHLDFRVGYYNWLSIEHQELHSTKGVNFANLFREKPRPLLKPIYCSSLLGLVKVTESMLDRGADINAKTYAEYVYPLHAAASRGHERVVRLLLDRGARCIFIAAGSGHCGVAGILLQTHACETHHTANYAT